MKKDLFKQPNVSFENMIFTEWGMTWTQSSAWRIVQGQSFVDQEMMALSSFDTYVNVALIQVDLQDTIVMPNNQLGILIFTRCIPSQSKIALA